VFEDLPFEAGKIKGNLDRLKAEIEKEQIDRLKCRAILTEILVAYEKMKYFILKEWDSYIQKVPAQDLLATVVAVWGGKVGRDSIESSLGSRVATVTSAIYSIDNPQYYDNSSLRRTLSELAIATEGWLTVLDKEIFVPQSKALGAYSRLGELIGAKLAGLNENWLVANSYLSAMEIAVNKVSSQLSLDVGPDKKDFAQKFKELATVLETKGISLSSLERQLPGSFWRIRNEVVHGGYSPDEQELELVVTWVKRLVNSLLKAM
jgi:hypothetical protein